MKKIKNVLICGLGAIGTIYADIISKHAPENLKILVDEDRLKKYKTHPTIFNGKKLNLNYVLPSENNFKADLIIIATKYDGLKDAIKNIKNFVDSETIILSLLNGITSEQEIEAVYGKEKLVYSYFIGHSAIRHNRHIYQDGTHKVVFGSTKFPNNIERVKKYFDKVKINYETPKDIKHSYWLKFMLNVSTNQVSAISGKTFGEMLNDEKCKKDIVDTMKEVQKIADAEGVLHYETLVDEAYEIIKTMSPEGKTSMLQDVIAKRKTEVDIFAGEIIKLGKKYNIPTPKNEELKKQIEALQS